MSKILFESKAWVGLRNASIMVYKDKIDLYYNKNLVKSYLIKDIEIISQKGNEVSTTINFIYNGKKEKIAISNDKIKDVLKLLNDDDSNSEDSILKDEIKQDEVTNEQQNNGMLEFLWGAIVLIGGFIWLGYTQNWFNFLGINTTGISSGCYYQESEKNALCFDGKKAYFKSDNSTEYYVTYTYDKATVEDAYGHTIASCKPIKDSKNIICGSSELHKK